MNQTDELFSAPLPRLRVGSPVTEAAEYFRENLKRNRRPTNTIDAYMYDLAIFARDIPGKYINQVTSADISRFLAAANSTATRKRRLTTLRQFFSFLINDARVLSIDPTAEVVPNRIELREPKPLSAAGQEDLISAAADDEPWSLTAILLMLRVGLSRADVLNLERGQVDRTHPGEYRIQLSTEDLRKPARNRMLVARPPFPDAYETYLETTSTQGRLFPIGFQALNGMVDRVRRRAGIARSVTPRTLRETFIATRFGNGATEDDLLTELGLSPDLRNRQSLRRFKPGVVQDPGSASN